MKYFYFNEIIKFQTKLPKLLKKLILSTLYHICNWIVVVTWSFWLVFLTPQAVQILWLLPTCGEYGLLPDFNKSLAESWINCVVGDTLPIYANITSGSYIENS